MLKWHVNITFYMNIIGSRLVTDETIESALDIIIIRRFVRMYACMTNPNLLGWVGPGWSLVWYQS